jgi:hypothetical protein
MGIPIRKHIGKLIAGISFLTLITTTCCKKNVHFGSQEFFSLKKDQYVWGLMPVTKIYGDSSGNVYSIGLILSKNLFLQGPSVRDTKKTGDSTAISLFYSLNGYYGDQIHEGNSFSLAVLGVGENENYRCKNTGNSRAGGLVAAINSYSGFEYQEVIYSAHTGDSVTVSGLFSLNEYKATKHNGNSKAKALACALNYYHPEEVLHKGSFHIGSSEAKALWKSKNRYENSEHYTTEAQLEATLGPEQIAKNRALENALKNSHSQTNRLPP